VSRCLSSHRRVPARVYSAIILVMVIVLSGLTSSAFGARIAYVKSAPPKVSPAKLASIKAAGTSELAGNSGSRRGSSEPSRSGWS